MDWIERVFGISPDGGDGTTEAMFFIAALAVAAAIIFRLPRFREYARRVFSRKE